MGEQRASSLGKRFPLREPRRELDASWTRSGWRASSVRVRTAARTLRILTLSSAPSGAQIKCLDKYGEYYQRYMQMVPYKIVPYIY